MNSRKQIQDELASLNSSLQPDATGNTFSVPEGYFDRLPGLIMARIKAEQEDMSAFEETARLSPLLSSLKKEMPFSVPDGYFEDNLTELPAFTSDNEAVGILSTIGKEMPFPVPDGYFEQLPSTILSKLPQPQAKVIPITRRKWMRLAVAAVMVGIITISGIFYFNNRKDIAVDNPQWVASKLKNVSDKAINEFVNTADASAANTVTVHKTTPKNPEVKKMLQDVSDKELDAFLAQVPDDEEELLTN
jgi:hypothetical protein